MLSWIRNRRKKTIAPSRPMPPESLIEYPTEDKEVDGYPEAVRWYLEYKIEGVWRPLGLAYEDPVRAKSVREFRENAYPGDEHRYQKVTITYETVKDIDD